MPEHMRKVFSGEIFDVHQWDQELFDGSKKTFERLTRPDTVTIIATCGGKILLAKEIQPGWEAHVTGLLGGRVDEGEEPLAAAKRELLEESGMVSDDWELLFSTSPVRKIDWTIHTFIARNCVREGEQRLDPGEDLEIIELTFDEFVRIACSEDFMEQTLGTRLLRMRVDGTLDELRKLLFS